MSAAQEDTLIDREKVQEVLSRFKLPSGVTRVEVSYALDHTGDPAVYLNFHLDKSIGPTAKAIKPISDFASQVISALYNAHIGGFAYSRLKAA